MTKRILAALIAMVMLLSLAACTGGQTAGTTTAPAATAATSATQTQGTATAAPTDAPAEPTLAEKVLAGDLVTLTYLPTNNMAPSGMLDENHPAGEWFIDNMNIRLEMWAYSVEKYQTILASGDLPDLMPIMSELDLENAILGNLIVCTEDYFDVMPNALGNEKLEKAYNYVRTYRSADTGKVWAMPTGVGYTAYNVNSVSRHRAVVDYTYFIDMYKDTGAPEVADIWGIIDVMEAMMEAYPTAEDGTKTYGTSLSYGGSSTYEATMQSYYYLKGYTVDNLPYFIETYCPCWNDDYDDIYSSIFDDDSGYKEGLKWFNAMSQRGVLDPDSINYDRGAATERVKNHYSFVGLPYLNVSTNDHQTLYVSDQKSCYSINSPFGSSGTWLGISSKTKNLDACLYWVDFTCDPYFSLICRNGPAGECWDFDDQGNYIVTDEYMACDLSGETYNWRFGSNAGKESGLIQGMSAVIGSGENLNGTDLQCALDKWPAIQNSALTANGQAWADFYGYQNIQEMLLDTNQLTFASGLEGVTNFCASADDLQQLTITSIQTTVIDYGWQMIYAKDDAEFEKLWGEMVQKCMDLGAQEIIDWRLVELEKAGAIAASF